METTKETLLNQVNNLIDKYLKIEKDAYFKVITLLELKKEVKKL